MLPPRPWLALFLAAALLATGCQRPAARPDVLLLTLDTTRADAVGAYGGSRASTPAIDALAAESVLYLQAISNTPYTGPAHASLLTGRFPPAHGLRDFLRQALPEEVPTLAEAFGAAGYQSAAFVSSYVLHPRFGLDQGFDRYSSRSFRPGVRSFTARRRVGGVFFERRAENTVDEALSWLARRDAERPFLLWIHLFDPHAPYDPPDAYRGPDPASDDPLEPRRQRYYEEVAAMDAQIGRLLRALEGDGLLSSLVVAVVADHGEALGWHGRPIATHSPHLADELLRVPMLLRAPGRLEPAVETRQVRIVDLFPTLLELAELPLPEGIDGESLLDLTAPRPAYAETFYAEYPKRSAEGEEWVAVREPGWKLTTDGRSTRLYDLNRDPAEQRDVAALHPERVALLEEQLARLRRRWPQQAPGRALELSEDEAVQHEQGLRALGYIE